MRARRLAVIAVLVAVGATACGSSSKSATTGSGTGATTTPSGQGTNQSTAPPTTGTLHGNSGSNFCDLARQDQAAFGSPNIATATPADLRKLYENLGSELEKARNAAPDAIKGDFDTFVTAFKPFLSALAAANYDFTKFSPTAVASLGTTQVKAASDHITQYMEQVCKISTTPTT